MKNQLSRIAVSGLLAAGLTLCSAGAFAQDGAAPAPDASAQPSNGPGNMRHQPPTPDEQIARMTKRYKLSPDQQAQIKPILANRQQQIMALRGDSSMSRDDKMAKMMDIRQDSTTKIEAVLNDTQKQQFAQDRQRMQERMQQRGDAPPTQ